MTTVTSPGVESYTRASLDLNTSRSSNIRAASLACVDSWRAENDGEKLSTQDTPRPLLRGGRGPARRPPAGRWGPRLRAVPSSRAHRQRLLPGAAVEEGQRGRCRGSLRGPPVRAPGLAPTGGVGGAEAARQRVGGPLRGEAQAPLAERAQGVGLPQRDVEHVRQPGLAGQGGRPGAEAR